MYAERVVIQTSEKGEIIQLPSLPANKRFEAIFLILDDDTAKAPADAELQAFTDHAASTIEEWRDPEEDEVWN